jgi:murein DD-endopeptidase MepM/ murein hydrolase activator NlpD
MVIIRHPAELVTIYAHNDENLVQAGDRVQQGDRIATVGRSGRATGYHVHFEVRHKTVPVDPTEYLPHRHQNMVKLDQG